MLYGRDASEYPCTGDWVIFQSTDTDKGIILDMLPRLKTLYRLKSGSLSEKQAIASYIDKAFIVQSLDSSFNERRIERFMLQLSEESIRPVLILTKTDLGFDAEKIESSNCSRQA
jgi:ribosome biogenesis GTPase